jgi:hypothetical protein
MQHNRWCVELAQVIVVISLGLDAIIFDNNEHDEPGNLQHHILLVVLVEAHVTLLVE